MPCVSTDYSYLYIVECIVDLLSNDYPLIMLRVTSSNTRSLVVSHNTSTFVSVLNRVDIKYNTWTKYSESKARLKQATSHHTLLRAH